MNRLVLWVAQGFGAGRIPIAPGTWGSVVGLAWLGGLLATGTVTGLLVGTLLGLALSVWCCGRAEVLLGKTDPPSVVLDEIVAVPVCFAGPIVLDLWRTGHLPAPAAFFQPQHLALTALLWTAFRFFDIVKPWPVRSSQALPGGWGITIDDLLAALYVNLVYAGGTGLQTWWG